MEHLLAPRDFSTPDSNGFLPIHDNQRGRNPTLIHFTIDGRHGILGACQIFSEALYKISKAFLWASLFDLATLLYFKRRFTKSAAMPNFRTLGIPSSLTERKRICREPFTLDKWNNMTAYKVDHWRSHLQGELPKA
ncbi:hypothetical protein AAG906_020598 [Vitis piasezkii]